MVCILGYLDLILSVWENYILQGIVGILPTEQFLGHLDRPLPCLVSLTIHLIILIRKQGTLFITS